jgi:hypothetical protein
VTREGPRHAARAMTEERLVVLRRIGKSFTISSILVSKRSVEAALPTILPRRLATHWQPAIQEEIREAMTNPD